MIGIYHPYDRGVNKLEWMGSSVEWRTEGRLWEEQHEGLPLWLTSLAQEEELSNPLVLNAARSSLTISLIFFRKKQSLENIGWRNVNQNITNNSLSNI